MNFAVVYCNTLLKAEPTTPSVASRTQSNSELNMYVVTCECTYVQGSPVPNIDSSALELHRPKHDRASACVIAQQYSSTTFDLRFRSRVEKFCALSAKMLLFPFLLALSKTVRNCWVLNCVSRTVHVSSRAFTCLPIYSRTPWRVWWRHVLWRMSSCRHKMWQYRQLPRSHCDIQFSWTHPLQLRDPVQFSWTQPLQLRDTVQFSWTHPLQLRDPVQFSWTHPFSYATHSLPVQSTDIRPTELVSQKRAYCNLSQKSLG